MSYKIIATTNGPVVQKGEDHFTLLDVALCIDLAEEEEGFVDDMGTHIANELGAATNEWIESFIGGLLPSQNKVVYYMNAGMWFKQFHDQYRAYKYARDNAPDQVSSSVSV